MNLDDQTESENVEDRRGQPGGGFGGLGGGLGGGLNVGSLGIGGVVVVLAAAYFLGIDPIPLLTGGVSSGGAPAAHVPAGPATPHKAPGDVEGRFAAKVLGSTEAVWTKELAARGAQYRRPALVLYSGATPTACGTGRSATGPFYCPADAKVYIDLSFNRLLRDRFKADGDFAQAYVIAHEVGHHVQNLLGTSAKVEAARRRSSEKQSNALLVRLELQADCLAGVWAFHADRDRRQLSPGDIEEALRAATAIGDDTLQRQAQGHVTPDSFTHGTSAQRVHWFTRGQQSGRLEDCNAFEAGSP
jgi:predicted metalloprotease